VSNLSIETLIEKVRSYNPEEVENVKKAYEYAKQLHEGQMRQSGEPYIIHPLNVAYILAELHADGATLCAGLLHDTIEDTNVKKEEIAELFSAEVAELVEGVTKLAKMNFSSKKDQNLANTRKIITSVAQDVRIIIIKLADRLHNMRTLEFKSEYKQKENALETLEIFAPLAYYIGAYRIKSELEDLSLRYLDYDRYRELEDKRFTLEKDTNEMLQEMLYKIQTILNDNGIPNEIKIRIKNIYGMYKKAGHNLFDIHDLLALKIMVDDVDNCYRAMRWIHKAYRPLNGEFKDYISNPKTNMYSSLHTTLFGPDNRLVQAQIRTDNMDRVASFGLSAYWYISKGEARVKMQEELKSRYQFFTSLTEINAMFGDNQQFVEQIKRELFSDNIYVYTPKGDIIELPVDSTPIDFAYKIHTHIGNTMVSAIVNDEYVLPGYRLQNKDRVRIITDELACGPKDEWLDLVKTAKAKQMILNAGKARIHNNHKL